MRRLSSSRSDGALEWGEPAQRTGRNIGRHILRDLARPRDRPSEARMNAMLVRQLPVIVLGGVERHMRVTYVVRDDGGEEFDVIQGIRVAACFLLLERLHEPSINLIDSPR